ncbi:hypothetical protein EYC84_005153 [Monilinia fructicola]|uniref:Uncharacterized protein n=1 Tax=Monilinia fructicola TaxID=38448 RepID=A0A5M9JZI7_MONFR|nr:hypothetical protein EYC84_005153 [Monilinia fructicola]
MPVDGAGAGAGMGSGLGLGLRAAAATFVDIPVLQAGRVDVGWRSWGSVPGRALRVRGRQFPLPAYALEERARRALEAHPPQAPFAPSDVLLQLRQGPHVAAQRLDFVALFQDGKSVEA